VATAMVAVAQMKKIFIVVSIKPPHQKRVQMVSGCSFREEVYPVEFYLCGA
jgi:hypothetical protein